jgi:hypothetical protein
MRRRRPTQTRVRRVNPQTKREPKGKEKGRPEDGPSDFCELGETAEAVRSA